MIEIYMITSIAQIPMAAMDNRELRPRGRGRNKGLCPHMKNHPLGGWMFICIEISCNDSCFAWSNINDEERKDISPVYAMLYFFLLMNNHLTWQLHLIAFENNRLRL